jgi:hypothetical protein
MEFDELRLSPVPTGIQSIGIRLGQSVGIRSGHFLIDIISYFQSTTLQYYNYKTKTSSTRGSLSREPPPISMCY